METDYQNMQDQKTESSNKTKIYIIVGIIVAILLIALIVVLVVVLNDTSKDEPISSTELTASQKLDILISEIVSACEMEQKAIIEGNYSCNTITDDQRATISEIFNEFNTDGDNEWSRTEFESFFNETSDESNFIDLMDTDNDGEVDFMEMMATLKKQSELTPDLFNNTYNDIIYELYDNAVYNLSDWRYFAYVADYVFNESFGDVYDGYPSGIDAQDWIDIEFNQQFNALEETNDDMIDLDEFINNSFMGYGLMYYVVYTDIESIYNAPEVTQTDIKTIVTEINATYDIWSDGLDEQLSMNSTRRRLWGLCNRFSSGGCKKSKCGEDGMQQSVACAGCDPSSGTCASKGCGKSTPDYIACLNAECVERGYGEKTCTNYVNNNV